jgi:hypothetical protein
MASVRQHNKMDGSSRRLTEMRWAVQTQLNKIIRHGSAVAFIVGDPDLMGRTPRAQGCEQGGLIPRSQNRDKSR